MALRKLMFWWGAQSPETFGSGNARPRQRPGGNADFAYWRPLARRLGIFWLLFFAGSTPAFAGVALAEEFAAHQHAMVEVEPGVRQFTQPPAEGWRKNNMQLLSLRAVYAPGASAPGALVAEYIVRNGSWRWGAEDFLGVKTKAFYGWSSRLGPVYTTNTRNQYIVSETYVETDQYRYARAVLIEVLDPAVAWSEPVVGTLRLWSEVKVPLREAHKRGDTAAACALVIDTTWPQLDDALVRDVLRTCPHRELKQLKAQFAAMPDHAARMAALPALDALITRLQRRHDQESFRFDTQDTGRLQDERIAGFSEELKEAQAFRTSVVDELKLLAEAQAREKSEMLAAENQVLNQKGLIATAIKQRVDAEGYGSRDYVGNAIQLYGTHIRFEGYLLPTRWKDWPAPVAKLLHGEEYLLLGTGTEVSVSEVDSSGLTVTPTTLNVTRGGWVAASSYEIAEAEKFEKDRVAARQRLAEIESELAALDGTPLGREVKGAAAEAAVRRVVRDGVERDEVLSVAPQNTYRLGVREDAQNREARRVALREERARLRSWVDGSSQVNAGRVWDSNRHLTVPALHVKGKVKRKLVLREQEGFHRLYGSSFGHWEEFEVDSTIEASPETFSPFHYFQQVGRSEAALNAGIIGVAKKLIDYRIRLHCNELKKTLPEDVVERERAAARWLFGIE